MKVGLVSPYPWDVPGGVVAHVRDLAEALIDLGHEVSVMSPVDDEDAEIPGYVTRAGRAVPVPYNGSVSRLLFGPVSAGRVRRWLRERDFDVLHVHSPETFSLSLLTVMNARGPIVATFHAAQPRSRILALLQAPLQAQMMEKVQGRIAVSLDARRTIVEHLGGDAVIIPNGVHVRQFRGARPLPGWPGDGGALGFVGRIDERRKGLAVLLDAFTLLAATRPGLRLLVAGPGDEQEMRAFLPDPLQQRVVFLGQVSEADKARVYRSVDAFVAPNTFGESFGIILLEAMAAGTPLVASDLDAFRRVVEDGRAGELAAVGDRVDLARACARVLDDAGRRRALVEAGARVVAGYDWDVIARQVLRVYETVAVDGAHVVPEESSARVAPNGRWP